MAYFNALKDPTVQAAVKKMSGAIPQAITPIGAGVAPQSSNVALASGMSASNAGASKGAIPSNVTYGSNVVGFDPNNATHKALADAAASFMSCSKLRFLKVFSHVCCALFQSNCA